MIEAIFTVFFLCLAFILYRMMKGGHIRTLDQSQKLAVGFTFLLSLVAGLGIPYFWIFQ